jgi:putative peptide zinc metalloprotease protein
VTLSPEAIAPSRTELTARPARRPSGGGDHGSRTPTAIHQEQDPPARADGVELLGRVSGSGYRRTPSLVRRADGQTIQVTPLLYQVLETIDGRRDYAEIAAAVSDRISRVADANDIRYLVEKKLRPLGVLRRSDGSQPNVKKANPLLALRLRKVVSNPEVTRRITAPLAALFRPQIVVPVLVAFAVTSTWVLFEKGLASATREAIYEPGMLLLVLGLSTLSAGFHEFGHAAASRYEGVAPGAMGVGLYLVWPVFYTDVTDSYRLDRRGRLRVDMGGLYFNALFALATVALWAVTEWDALLLLVPVQLLHMIHQLVPFVRFDGYHILADLTGVPDLFAHIKPTLLHMLPTRWGRKEPHVLRPWARVVVTLWVLAVVPILGFAFVMMVKVLPMVAATVWDSLGVRWEALQHNWSGGAVAQAGVSLVAMAAIALPVLSMTYLIIRVVRRTSLRVWRATSERPGLRAAAILAGMACLALVAWAWWPNGQYRPIPADERGTLIDPGRYGPSQGILTLPTSTSTAAPAPSLTLVPRLAVVLAPEGTPVTEPGPKRIVILPEPDVDDPTDEGWVFPFDPPAPPEEGDNQALAVNTEDGSTVRDVAFAVVWVTEGPVDQRNEAWAVASCTNCVTQAVAFQTVLALEDLDVVIPENVAVAVNYECRACRTEAVAVQLVATLTQPPTEEAIAQLDQVWEDLEELERNVPTLSLSQILDELMVIEARILEILVQDGAVQIDGTIAEASASTSAGTTAEEAPLEGSTAGSDPTITSGDTTADTSGEASGDASGDTSTTTGSEPAPAPAEPSPTPTQDPSPAPTQEPSPTPEPSPTTTTAP